MKDGCRCVERMPFRGATCQLRFDANFLLPHPAPLYSVATQGLSVGVRLDPHAHSPPNGPLALAVPLHVLSLSLSLPHIPLYLSISLTHTPTLPACTWPISH